MECGCWDGGVKIDGLCYYHAKVGLGLTRSKGDRGSSSGLGLSIVRAVAESHGGDVSFEDAHPGARFVVRLPRAEVPAQEPAPAAV